MDILEHAPRKGCEDNLQDKCIDENATRFLTEIMSTKLFGTDGIRAQAGTFPLNARSIVAIGRAIGEKLGGGILLGQDTRLSSPWIAGLLKQGLEQSSASIHDAGIIPTPAVALLTKADRYSGGVMISASHNPFEDNRSEERRVGKECRCWWAKQDENKD